MRKLERCPDLRSRKRRDQLLAVLKDAYEEAGEILEWGYTDNDAPIAREIAKYRYVLVNKATGEVVDVAYCDNERWLIRYLYRARPNHGKVRS